MSAFVYFDVGGTLIEPAPSVGEVYRVAGATFGLIDDAEALDSAFRAAWPSHVRRMGLQALSMGADEPATHDWWRSIVFEVFDLVQFDGERAACFAALFAAFESPDAWTVFDDVTQTLDALARRGLPMGVLSNWDYRLPPLLERIGLADHFEPIIVSALVQMQKPEPRIFELAAERADRPLQDLVYVGDQYALDIEPALKLGMRAFLIDRAGSSNLDCAIGSLSELVDLI